MFRHRHLIVRIPVLLLAAASFACAGGTEEGGEASLTGESKPI